MTTLGELHDKAGSPDLSHWKSIEAYSIEEAALLTAGIDPLLYEGANGYKLREILRIDQPTNWTWAIMVMRGICESICTGSINCNHVRVVRDETDRGNCIWTETVTQIDLTLLDAPHIDTHETRVAKKEHYKWLLKKEFIFEAQSRGLIAKGTYSPHSPVQKFVVVEKEAPLLSAPKYTTPAIDCMNEVIDQFWIDYDPESNSPPPKGTVITAWLGENGHKWGVTSQNQIMAIDLIARHPTAKLRTKK